MGNANVSGPKPQVKAPSTNLCSDEKWELTLGRQRINWGVNLAFNPNDLFNAYSLIDFDYQERPGSDAIRFQYFTNELSSFETAVQFGKSLVLIEKIEKGNYISRTYS